MESPTVLNFDWKKTSQTIENKTGQTGRETQGDLKFSLKVDTNGNIDDYLYSESHLLRNEISQRLWIQKSI